MSSTLKTDLMASVCADPTWGPLYRIFRDGDYIGSWYDADQMYWRIARDNAAKHIGELVTREPTPDAVTEALAFAETLTRAQREYHTRARDVDYAFLDPTSIIQTWAPHAFEAPAPAPAPEQAAVVAVSPPRDLGRPPRHPGAPVRGRREHGVDRRNDGVRRVVTFAAPPPAPAAKPAVKVPQNPFAALGNDDDE
jgi:hypothetical protein